MYLIIEFDVFLFIRKKMSLRPFSYLIVMFTKRKQGAHIALPIKGNVHLLFHNI